MPKRPAACLEEPLVFRTHLRQCTCGGNLSQSHDVPVALYSMDSKRSVRMVTMRCTTYSCRATFGPNFRYDASKKINTAQPADITKAGALFVNNKVGFSVSFLEYHSHLEFRSFVAATAVQDVYRHTFGIKNMEQSDQWRKVYSSAIMYYTGPPGTGTFGHG